LKIFIIVLYILILLVSSAFVTIYRYKKIKEAVGTKEYHILNHDMFIRILLSILGLCLVAATIHFIIQENDYRFIVVDVILATLVNVFLLMLVQIYTTLFLLVSANDKIYLFYKSEIAEFDRSRVHFQKNKRHTLMYYKDDLVINTKKIINLKAIDSNLK